MLEIGARTLSFTMPTHATSPSWAQHSSINLQLCVLRNLPTPVLVLSPSRTVIFANRAAAKILGQRDPIQSSSHALHGKPIAELGIRLLYDRVWGTVLDKLAAAQKRAAERGEEDTVHELDVVVSQAGRETRFRILANSVTADDGVHYVLSFEQALPDLETKFGLEAPAQQGNTKPLKTETGDGKRTISTSGMPNVLKMKQAVFDSCKVAGFILSGDEKFYLSNRRFREILGDKIMGDADGIDVSRLRATLPVWDERFERRLKPAEMPGTKMVRAQKTFTNYRIGITHVTTGVQMIMNVSGECLYDDDTGEFIGGLCWCTDFQEYSDFVAEQIQSRLNSHETICNVMPHFVWTTTPEGTCDWFSQRWYEFTGLTEEESVGIGYTKAIHPDDIPVLRNEWEKFRVDGIECELEVRYKRASDGVYRWMLARACPLRDEEGNILKWYGTNTDIHDLVMARIEAARNKTQMLTVLSHAEVNLFSMDKDRKITMAEGAMLWKVQGESITSKSWMIGKDAIEVSQGNQAGGLPDYEKNVVDILAGKVGMASSEDPIGDKVYRTRLVAELEHDPSCGGKEAAVVGVLGLSIDVTDMKARATLEVDNTRLMVEERAAKDSNRVKSQFLANMSHEMRTPIAGVIGMVDLLAEDQTLSAEQREYVDSIQLSAKALLTIVNDILDFSKIESGRLDIEEVPFNLSNVVGELCKLLSMFVHQKGLIFTYDNILDDSLEVLGDPGRIRQVLSNLLTNALKFTTEGSVRISVSSKPVNPQLAGEDHIEVQFVIEDTGIGIEKHVLDKLFMPFRQGDSSTARLYGGTGLGLTISKNLATLMRGSINLESAPGVGSTAIFSIPLKISSWCMNPAFQASSPPNAGFPIHVPSKSKKWTGLLAHRSVNQDLLNQQISSSVVTTGYTPSSLPPLKRVTSNIDALAMTPQMTPEQRAKCHVLVVEDNAINQTIALKTVRKLGFPVTATWNGREALSYLRSPSPSQPRPQIILMDVQMPVMDGYEATRILRTRSEYSDDDLVSGELLSDELSPKGVENKMSKLPLSSIPVIAMTASAIQGDREKCFEAGMDDYLAKPVEKGRLEEMLVKWGCRTSA